LGYDNNSFKFICINNNNNTVVVVNETLPEQRVPAEPTTANLNVTKLVTCTDTTANGPVDGCAALEQQITEGQILIEVTNDNPDPSQFFGSQLGTIVTLGAGGYVVLETPDAVAIAADIAFLEDQFPGKNFNGPNVSFTGNCMQTGMNSFSATGGIGPGESQTCGIVNNFEITAEEEFTAGLSIITQGTEDLSALAKIAKLKKQWLDLLP